jgi:flagellar hook-associated protein 2
MATSSTTSLGSSTGITQLDSVYQQLITSTMSKEKEPLTALTNQRDTATTQKAIYTDLAQNLTNLQTQVEALVSTSANYGVSLSKNATISNTSTGHTVLTASTTSEAVAGTYDINVTSLAKAQRVASERQSSSTDSLGIAGTIVIGGGAARSQTASATVAGLVDSFGTSTIASGQSELSSGTYSIETRNDPINGWQFRLVDQYGQNADFRHSDGTFKSGWQAITGEPYDTGRGLTINFGSDTSQYTTTSQGHGAAQVKYSAQGVSISVETSDSLNTIASKINSTSFVPGNEVVATVIDQQLVLTAKNSGTAHAIEASGNVLQSLGVLDGAGAFSHPLTAAGDAVFNVNQMSVTRSSNQGLADVIPGVSLTLNSDAENETATLVVGTATTAAKNAVQAFINQFNSLQTYLTQKTAVTKVSDTQYKRAALSGETTVTSLRFDLLSQFNTSVKNNGIYQRLSDIGLTIGDGFQISITDSSKLENALQNNLGDVQNLLDAKMGNIDALLKQYTGTSGILSGSSKGLDDQITRMNSKIDTMNTNLQKKQDKLVTQYSAIQAQMTSLTYLQQEMTLFASYSTTNISA